MDTYHQITLFNHPWIFFTDKIYTGWYDKRRGLYFPTIFTWFIALVGFYAEFQEFISAPRIVALLCSFLFVFGIINVWLATISGQAIVRNKRLVESASIIHQIAEIIRDYRAQKIIKSIGGFTENEIIKELQHILETLSSKFIIPNHGPGTNITLKYHFNNKMHSIRIGPDTNRREAGTENREDCHVFNVLSGPQKLKFLYVKDTQKPDDLEREAMGQLSNKITARANGHYGTFIAFPINTGNMSPNLTGIPLREALGMLGIDYKKHYFFGNINEYEINMIACIVDSMSEIVYDLIEVEKKSLIKDKPYQNLTGRVNV